LHDKRKLCMNSSRRRK